MKPVGNFDKGDHIKVGGKVSVGDDENMVYTAGEWMKKRSVLDMFFRSFNAEADFETQGCSDGFLSLTESISNPILIRTVSIIKML